VTVDVRDEQDNPITDAERASVEVGEDEDGCHVHGKSLTLTLIAASDAP
jgi:hypothetical protein